MAVVGWLLVFLAACADSAPSLRQATSTPGGVNPTAEALTMEQVGGRLQSGADQLRGVSIDLIAYVNPAPARDHDPGTRLPGCPIIPEALASLTDRPFPSEFEVAGVTLPNTLPSHLPQLRLVIPYQLGMIDVPQRARLRGHFFDPDYRGCSEPDRLFILEEVLAAVPADTFTPEAVVPRPVDWASWHDPTVGLGIDYPAAWERSESRNQGAIVKTTFTGQDHNRQVTLTVLAGATHWNPNSDLVPPAPLAGDHRLPATAGGAPARLVDVLGESTANGRHRTIRVVFNYQENTVMLSTQFVDGVALDQGLLAIFTEMARRLRFDKPIGISDPADPTTGARSDLGPGPFIGEATAAADAVELSGLLDAEVIEGRLVPEREAREARDGTCRDFPGRPDGVWLVLVKGVLPTGQTVQRLIYLDAVTGHMLCQAAV